MRSPGCRRFAGRARSPPAPPHHEEPSRSEGEAFLISLSEAVGKTENSFLNGRTTPHVGKEIHRSYCLLPAPVLRNVVLIAGVFGNVTALSSQITNVSGSLQGRILFFTLLGLGLFKLLCLNFNLPRMTFLFLLSDFSAVH